MANGELVPRPLPAIRQLLPADLLYRVLGKKKWLVRSNLFEAFLRRRDETGISVCIDCQPAECPKIMNLDSYGVAELSVGGVTNLGLVVTPNEPNHAEIEGIPDDPKEAEYRASQLAEIAVIVDQTPYKRPRD